MLANGVLYPMRPVPMMQNRWEGTVPVPPGTNSVSYRFKFDYLYQNMMGAPPQAQQHLFAFVQADHR